MVLFSGGLDSYCISKLVRPDINLYVDTRSKYSDLEIKNLPSVDNLVIDRRLDLSRQQKGAFVPARNAYLALIASSYGETIILGSMEGDVAGDHGDDFAEITTDLLNKIYEPQYWLPEGRRFQVLTPYSTFTKSELIKTVSYTHLTLPTICSV